MNMQLFTELDEARHERSSVFLIGATNKYILLRYVKYCIIYNLGIIIFVSKYVQICALIPLVDEEL